MTYKKHELGLTIEGLIALQTAITAGAFAERQATLRELIAHNRGSQKADAYERELEELANAADSLMRLKP